MFIQFVVYDFDLKIKISKRQNYYTSYFSRLKNAAALNNSGNTSFFLFNHTNIHYAVSSLLSGYKQS